MPRSEREAYYAQLPQDQANQQRAAYRAYVRKQNADYLRHCYDKIAVCPPVTGGGGGNTQNWSSSPMVFAAPVMDGGFIKEILLTFNLTMTLATGTSAAYALNAGAPFNTVKEIIIDLNNNQVKVPLLVYKYVSQMRGYLRPTPGNIIAGTNVTAIQNQEATTFPVATGANTWTFKVRVPLNAGYRRSAAGLLPSMSDSTRAKITLVPTDAPLGPDPLNSPIAATTGSGQAVTISGTVKCEAIMHDGSTYWSDKKLRLLLDEEPTVQAARDLILQPLNAGTLQRQKLTILNQHLYVVSIVVDGQQSTSFSTVANMTRLELDKDQVGQNSFYAFGSNMDQLVEDYYERLRWHYGQDFDQGVIPWIHAPGDTDGDASTMEGQRILNMRPGGYVNVSHAYQVTSVGGVAGITPRVETYCISLNPDGLQLVQR